jgi:hypothetical protein
MLTLLITCTLATCDMASWYRGINRKKLILKSFSIVFVKYEKNHIYRMLSFNEIIYRVLFVIWIKKKHLYNVEISIETSSKQSIFESINFSTKKQVLKSNSMIILVSIQIFQLTAASFSFSSSIIKINTLFNDFVSTISLILNSLKRHFELRYRLSFFDLLSLLIMNVCKTSQIFIRFWNLDRIKRLWMILIEISN